MALVLADRVKETTTTTGTGAVTLAGASTGFQSFAIIGNTNTTYYTIAGQTGNEWEVGIGTYSTTGPTLTRTTVLANSSATQPSALNFSAGTKDVFVTYPSSKSVNLDGSGNVSGLGTISSGTWQGTAIGLLYGGSGQTTAQLAMNAFAGAVTSGSYLRGNGTNVVMNTIQVADVPTLNQSTTGSAATLTTGRTIAITGDLAYTSPSFDGSTNVTAAGTLATVNANVGSFTNATLTVNGKGLITAASSGTAPVTSVTATSPVASSGGATPAISLSAGYGDTLNPYASKTANFVLAAPNGTAGVPTFRAVVAADIPTLNQNTTGSAATLTTTRAIYGNNFDGSAALTQVIASTYGGTGNGFTKFTGATTTEKTYTLPNATATILTSNAAVTVAQGGTGQTSYTNGQLLIGNTTGNTLTKATLSAGTGISITNSTGSISIASTVTGTVTSVAATVPAFLSVAGSPITTTGTLAITLSGTALPVLNGGTGVTTSTGSGNNVLSTSPTLTTPVLGTPTSGTLSNCTVDGTDAVGFRNVPVNSQSAAYTTILADSGKVIFHPSTDANARTFTIPANSSVAYPIGTAITFINMTSQVVTIAITTDTMYLSSAGTTGSRSLAQYGSATALKITSTNWLISGSGLT